MINPTLRPERPEDIPAIHEVNQLAFPTGNEARLVDTLRDSPGFTTSLSLVADLDGQIIGHILFSPIAIKSDTGEIPALALAPMAVRPEFQNMGVGSALVRAGLAACRQLGHRIVIVLGHENFYPHFGFEPARPYGIRPPFPVSDPHWMVVELEAGALEGVRGTVQYPPPFADV